MVGGETSCRRTLPLRVRQVPKGARTSKRKQLRKSNCQNTGDGVKAQERQGTAADPAPPYREGDAREHAPRLGEHPLTKWPLLHGGSITGRQAEEALSGTRPACEGSNPVWECMSSSLGENALETQDGATSEKTTFPKPPARSRTEVLGLD